MAHDLAFDANGNAQMVFHGETPWHKHGKSVPALMSVQEALNHVNFPEVIKVPATFEYNGNRHEVKTRMVVIRKDTGAEIGSVGPDYQIVQYRDALGGLMEGLTKEGGAIIETAGLLHGGARGWIMARLPDDIKVDGTKGDTIRRYLLVYTSHDGTSNLKVVTSPVRTVCANTVAAAFAEKDSGMVSIRHTRTAHQKMSRAAVELAKANEYYKRFAESANILAAKAYTPDMAKDFLNALIPAKEGGKVLTRSENIRAEILALADHGVGQDIEGVKGTLWALYNGVTEYTDYHRGTRGADDSERSDNRLDSVWFGSGAELKTQAFDLLMAMSK
jgi:phage/plasmid-like protein (TIGR03299 family)